MFFVGFVNIRANVALTFDYAYFIHISLTLWQDGPTTHMHYYCTLWSTFDIFREKTTDRSSYFGAV